MEIQRDIMVALLSWKQRTERKPLIIQGARQIGKTWVMRKFGEAYFEHVAYFNFDASEELCRSLNIQRIRADSWICFAFTRIAQSWQARH